MANKIMHHMIHGDDAYEIVDKAARAGLSNLEMHRIGRTFGDINQGVCFIESENAIVYTTIKSGNKNPMLYKIDKDTGSILASVEMSEIHHGNSLAFDPDAEVIYIATLNGYILVVNNDSNFSLNRTIDTGNIEISGISLDPITKILYCTDNTNTYSLINDTLNKIFSYERVNMYAPQGMGVYNGLMYFVSSAPSLIEVYNLNGQHVKSYNIPYYIDHYITGECEDIEFVSDGSFIMSSNVDAQITDKTIIEFWRGNVNENTFSMASTAMSSNRPNRYVYVDLSSTSFNPDGSENNKYRYLSEGLLSLYSGVYSPVVFSVAFGTYEENPRIFQSCTITFNGSTLNGKIEIYNSNVSITNLIVSCGSSNQAIYVNNSVVVLDSLSFTGSMIRLLSATNSDIKLLRSSYSGAVCTSEKINLNSSTCETCVAELAKNRVTNLPIGVESFNESIGFPSKTIYAFSTQLQSLLASKYYNTIGFTTTLYKGNDEIYSHCFLQIDKHTFEFIRSHSYNITLPFSIVYGTYAYTVAFVVQITPTEINYVSRTVIKQDPNAPDISSSLETIYFIK